MADSNKEKQATCPICGYTDSAYDADALERGMQEHMRQAHNMSAPINAASTDLKHTGRDLDDRLDAPVAGAETDLPGWENTGPNEARDLHR
jgi:predicted small metal-binding protein